MPWKRNPHDAELPEDVDLDTAYSTLKSTEEDKHGNPYAESLAKKNLDMSNLEPSNDVVVEGGGRPIFLLLHHNMCACGNRRS